MIEYKRDDFIDPDKSVYLFYGFRKKEKDEPPHTHGFIEIVYILDGVVDQWVNGVYYETRHGDMLLLPCGSVHSFVGRTNFKYVNICFSPRFSDDAELTVEMALAQMAERTVQRIAQIAPTPKLTFFGGERKAIEDLLMGIRGEIRGKEESWGRVANGYLNVLVEKMLRKAEEGCPKDVGDVWKELSEYIDANLDADLTLATLSKRCFYNPSYFSRVFKEKFQMPLLEYVNRKRIAYAVQLLEKTEFSIDIIGAKVGFSDRSAFYRAFSKYVKSTPSDYRKVKKCDK